MNHESFYVCQPNGFEAIRLSSDCTESEIDEFCRITGFVRVQFKTVMQRPYICPVNGAEFGTELYPVRMPCRPDGKWLIL